MMWRWRRRRIERLLAVTVARDVRKHYGKQAPAFVRDKQIETAKSGNMRLNRIWCLVQDQLR